MKTVKKLVKQPARVDASDLNLNEKLVSVDRVAKVVKGGKRLSFRALVVVGDGQGHVGVGLDTAREVPEAIRKAGVAARKSMFTATLQAATIPHEVRAKFGAAQVLLRPAFPGTGILAGGGVRAVLEAAGVKDVLTKSLGCANKINVVKATMLALASLRQPGDTVAWRKGQPLSAPTMEAKNV
jgi:small subunit ribosomal protein S5